MSESRTGIGGLFGRLRERLARFGAPSAAPGSETWFTRLALDIQQAERNEDDYRYVIVRREREIRMAHDRPEAGAGWLALAHLEWALGREEAAAERLQRALESGPLPEAVLPVAFDLLSRVAEWARRSGRVEDALALHERAFGWAATVVWQATCWNGVADIRSRNYDVENARKACEKGLQLLVDDPSAVDPYRAGPGRLPDLDADGQRLLVELVAQQIYCDAFDLELDRARRRGADLRAALGGSLGEDQRPILAQAEAWLDVREGRFADAERYYGDRYDELLARDITDGHELTWILTSLGSTFLEQDLVDEASGVTKKLFALDHLARCQQRHRAHCLRADVSWRQGDAAAARADAETVLSAATDPAERTDALRILAELALDRGDREEARRLAQESVELTHATLGDDLFLARPLLTLARTTGDPREAEAIHARAAALPIPPGHPLHEEIAKARACGRGGRHGD